MQLNKQSWSLLFILGMLGSFGSARADNESPDLARALVEQARKIQATTDVALRVEDVLEPANLRDACKKHYARLDPVSGKLPAASIQNPEHVGDMVRCGKWIFFSADFESKMAIPENLLQAIPEIFPDEAGPAFAKTGLIENPFDPGFPIGFARLEKSPWGVLSPVTGAARGISCATCHFGKMPDGRYAAGMPNQDLDFGKANALFVYSAWRADSKKNDADVWPEDLRNFYQGLDKKLQHSLSPRRALFDVAKIVSWVHATDLFYNFTGASRPIFDEASTWLSATPNQYYASSPLLPIPGKSYWMSAPAAWDMKNYPGDYEAHRARPLSSFSPTKSAEDFVALAYIFQTGLARYAEPKYVDPLVLYFRSLKTPKNLQRPDPAVAAQGAQIFAANCQSCHNGSDGETLEAWPAAVLHTPEVLVDPLLNYIPPKKLSASIYEQTIATLGYVPLTNQGIFSRKLKGIYARRHIMVNGSVQDLNDAFCLHGSRGEIPAAADGLRNDVHADLCQNYTDEQKQALIAFLNSWD